MAKLLLAKEVNKGIQKNWEEDLKAIKAQGVTPTLATVRIGDDGADISYEKSIIRTLGRYDLAVDQVVFPEDVGQEEVIEKLEDLSQDEKVHGILLFQPLPQDFDDRLVKSAIKPEKDVDCATAHNLGATMAGWEDGFAYCAPAAVMELLHFYDIPIKGKNFCIIGSGLVVGKPLAMLLVNELATVSLTNVYTDHVPSFSKPADIIISATGVPGLVDDSYVREGQIVIDVGTSFVDGKLKGDVNREKVEPLVKAMTPTPGGIGGITTTVLAQHLVTAARRQVLGK